MENIINRFLSVDIGSGIGSGDDFASGFGPGAGTGYGDGCGYGSGSGTGSGRGSGNITQSIKSICGEPLHMIDNVPTIIRQVFGNYAKGAIVMDDMTTRLCYIAKQGNTFAHGNTLREARDALREKLFKDMPEEEHINAFLEAHPDNGPYLNRDLFQWHNKLTGSCLAGRNAFVENHGIDLEGSSTLAEFIEMTKDTYGGDVIRRLEERMKETQNDRLE